MWLCSGRLIRDQSVKLSVVLRKITEGTYCFFVGGREKYICNIFMHVRCWEECILVWNKMLMRMGR